LGGATSKSGQIDRNAPVQLRTGFENVRKKRGRDAGEFTFREEPRGGTEFDLGRAPDRGGGLEFNVFEFAFVFDEEETEEVKNVHHEGYLRLAESDEAGFTRLRGK
tara:strand:- start:1225 stop:1542 length:318 start_codon:yes stop_codon:yes gene_type:complete